MCYTHAMDLSPHEAITAGEPLHREVRILVVDDNPEHRMLIVRNLRRGIQTVVIEEVETGGDCLARMAAGRFDLVLLDYTLPDTNGLEILALLRRRYSSVPVIMVTGQGDERIIREAMRQGASDYVIKTPEFLEHLVNVVARTLAQQSLRTQLDQSKEELVRRNQELSILLDATTAVSSQLDLDSVLNILAERIGNAVGCTFVKILLMTEDNRGLVVKAVHPVQDLEWDPALGHLFEVKAGSPVFSVIFDQAPLILNTAHIQELNAAPAVQRGLLGNLEQIQSLLIMPVIMMNECLGVVVLGERRHWERSPFTPEKSGLAMALIQHAGIAIKNAHHYQVLQKEHLETIMGLAEALETRDAYTRGHGDRAVEYAQAIAHELGLTPEQTDRLRYAAILHDIGKIGIPDDILNKPGKLTPEEYGLMKTHPEKGANILSKIRFLERIAPLIRNHHERWDGTGYPDGLQGRDIPIESRIVSVLDSYDAMTSDRIYRKAPGRDYAISELRRCAGAQYDADVVAAFLKILGVPQEEPKAAVRAG